MTTRLAVLAGEGELTTIATQEALQQGFDVKAYCFTDKTAKTLRQVCQIPAIYVKYPGMVQENLDRFREDQIQSLIFVGKVPKWVLLKAFRLDEKAKQLWKTQKSFNDDAVMHRIIEVLSEEGITILPQSDFLKPLFLPKGCYTSRQPSPEEEKDIALGMHLAKEMGRLDIGQTVVVHNGMVLAVEAIEGTDQAIARAKRWGSQKGGIVAKVEKPEQDKRFDIPTVGLRTLKAMKQAGLSVLAIEADKTLVVQKDKLIAQANQWQMTVISV